MQDGRKISITTDLTQFALNMGYTIETDPYQDCFHNGYNPKDIQKMNLKFSPELSNIDKIFPGAVALALENAERDAWAAASRKFRLKALKESLLRISFSKVQYVDIAGQEINAGLSAIVDVSIDEKNDKITLEIINPEHLINSLVYHDGRMTEPLSSTSEESNSKIESVLPKLKLAFDIYGMEARSGEVPSQFYPDTDQEFFNSEIKQVISDYDLDDVCKEIRNSAERGDFELKDLVNIGSTFTEFSPEEIRTNIKNYYLKLANKWV